jgi:argininosuccinate lyase
MVGEIVAYAMKHKKVLETLTLEEYKSFSDLFEADLYSEIELSNCVVRRISAGGTGSDSVAAQIKWLREYLSE